MIALLFGLLLGCCIVLAFKVYQYRHQPGPKPQIVYLPDSPVPFAPPTTQEPILT